MYLEPIYVSVPVHEKGIWSRNTRHVIQAAAHIHSMGKTQGNRTNDYITAEEAGFYGGQFIESAKSEMRNLSLSSSVKTPLRKFSKSPVSSCSTKIKNSEFQGCILAVTEGRGQARGEVGIASMDLRRPLLVLCQISDGQRYMNSLTKMNVFNFSEVIVPNTFVDSEPPNKLYCDIRRRFPNATLTTVQRRHFNETAGLDLIRRYCCSDSASVMILLQDKFYALSAAAALIKYVEFAHNFGLWPQSLQIEYQGMEDAMLIDLDTANRLELVMCMSHPETNLTNSLMGVVNHCQTKGGVRLLRANILQPFYSLHKIKDRLNCIEELIGDPALFGSLEASVKSFANVENLMNLYMRVPQRLQNDLRTAECQLKYILLLKTTLELLPKLVSALQNAKSTYFRRVLQNLTDSRFALVLEKISKTIHENARTTKGSVAAHLHGCFAIKPGVNGLLDVAKRTYCEIVQDITDHVADVREKHNLPLRISFTSKKGFHLRCPRFPNTNIKDLPEEFILAQRSRAAFTFYTTKLVALDKRSQHILDEIKLMTNAILFELLVDIRYQFNCLFNLSEIISEIDVIVSLAHVSSTKHYIKPDFGDRLYLKESRHPILDAVREGETVPNDVFAENEKNFIILTGPNQSGKSIYIRQIALLQILAQIGCFVPATEAIFKLANRLFSRIGFDDSIESNACTMIVEMRDVEYIRQNLTADSIVIIDELCRGTSVDEGTHLAFAICEQLLDSPAFVFFTTHYLFLTRLEEMYSNVANWHFECELNLLETGKTVPCFSHILKPGFTTTDSYGLPVAELTSFPKEVWVRANKISEILRQNRKPQADIDGLLTNFQLAEKLRRELAKDRSRKEAAVVEFVKTFREKHPNIRCQQKRGRISKALKPSEAQLIFLPISANLGRFNSEFTKIRSHSLVAVAAEKLRRKYKLFRKKKQKKNEKSSE